MSRLMTLDVHSHSATRRGYPFRTEAELAHHVRVWKEASYVPEGEMADEPTPDRVPYPNGRALLETLGLS